MNASPTALRALSRRIDRIGLQRVALTAKPADMPRWRVLLNRSNRLATAYRSLLDQSWAEPSNGIIHL